MVINLNYSLSIILHLLVVCCLIFIFKIEKQTNIHNDVININLKTLKTFKTKDIVKKYPEANIKIITSDMDYLQLARENVELFDLKYKKLTERKSSFNNAEKDLFVKILTGDKSDNIPGVFKKCGKKTALKYYNDRDLLEKQLNKNEGSKQIMERNELIINFDKIPDNLINDFYEKYEDDIIKQISEN